MPRGRSNRGTWDTDNVQKLRNIGFYQQVACACGLTRTHSEQYHKDRRQQLQLQQLNPIAILSKPAPMAILLSKSNGKFIKDSPKATSSRQPQWLFYQGKWPSHQSQLPLYQSQWPFYQSRLPRQFIKASPSGNFMMVERSP